MNLFISSCLICFSGDVLITRLKTAGATDTVGGAGGICSEGEEKGFRRRRRCPLCQNWVLLPFCGVAAAAAALSFRRLDSDANTDTDHGNFAGGREGQSHNINRGRRETPKGGGDHLARRCCPSVSLLMTNCRSLS